MNMNNNNDNKYPLNDLFFIFYQDMDWFLRHDVN